MKAAIKNLCIRCGKERIVVKTWTERSETTVTQYSMAHCPDDECQKLVDQQNALIEEKRLFHANKPKKSHWLTNSRKKKNTDN